MYPRLASFLICILLISVITQAQTAIQPSDLSLLNGNWKGSLTYLDYSTKKPFTMPADAKIQYQQDKNVLILVNSYPKEPKANNIDTIVISKEGTMIDREVIVKRSLLQSGDIEVVTEYMDVDGNNNEPALIRQTYIIGKSIFTKRKQVKFKGQDWILRNEFIYSRE